MGRPSCCVPAIIYNDQLCEKTRPFGGMVTFVNRKTTEFYVFIFYSAFAHYDLCIICILTEKYEYINHISNLTSNNNTDNMGVEISKWR